MTDLQYWFCSLSVWLILFGGLINLYLSWNGIAKNQRAKHPEVILAAILYLIGACYTLGLTNRDAAKDKITTQEKSDNHFKGLEEKYDKQTIYLGDIRNQNKVLLSLFQRNTFVSTNPSPETTSSKNLVIQKLRSFISWGDKIQIEGTKTDVKIDDYKKDRDKWLNDIRYYLLTDKTIQGNEKWKDWAGGNGCNEAFECRDDLTEIDYPNGCPEDRKNYFRDNGRRINNLKQYVTELEG